jgi:import receptor subunit TOM22
MVKLEEVMDEEFNREQAGPQVEDEWDTSDGTNKHPAPAQQPSLYPTSTQTLLESKKKQKLTTLTKTESEASEDEEEYMPDETFADRLAALKDIVPPTYRKHLSNTLSTTSSWVQTTLNYGGKTLWVVSTSVLLLGVPWALAFAEEQQMAEMEREMKMQQSANEVSDSMYSMMEEQCANNEITASYSAATLAG